MPYLGVEPEYEEDELNRVNVLMPDVCGMTQYKAENLLRESGLSCRVIGTGSTVVSQSPAKGSSLPGNSTVLLYMDGSMPTGKVTVPDLTGMTASEATQALTDLGLYLQAKGTDPKKWYALVTAQDIPPGTEVERGSTVTVRFADTTAMD